MFRIGTSGSPQKRSKLGEPDYTWLDNYMQFFESLASRDCDYWEVIEDFTKHMYDVMTEFVGVVWAFREQGTAEGYRAIGRLSIAAENLVDNLEGGHIREDN